MTRRIDPEIKALRALVGAIETLRREVDLQAFERVMVYIRDRYDR